MNATKLLNTTFIAIMFFVSACGTPATPQPTPTSTMTLTPTLTFTPTCTPTPTITPTPTPVIATFDDNLCEIRGSFTIDGELWMSDFVMFVEVIENASRYQLFFQGFSSDIKLHFMDVWIKHASSPGPNEMEDLPQPYDRSKINIYSKDNIAFHAEYSPVHLTVHVIPDVFPPAENEVLDSNYYSCDFVVEEIYYTP